MVNVPLLQGFIPEWHFFSKMCCSNSHALETQIAGEGCIATITLNDNRNLWSSSKFFLLCKDLNVPVYDFSLKKKKVIWLIHWILHERYYTFDVCSNCRKKYWYHSYAGSCQTTDVGHADHVSFRTHRMIMLSWNMKHNKEKECKLLPWVAESKRTKLQFWGTGHAGTRRFFGKLSGFKKWKDSRKEKVLRTCGSLEDEVQKL